MLPLLWKIGFLPVGPFSRLLFFPILVVLVLLFRTLLCYQAKIFTTAETAIDALTQAFLKSLTAFQRFCILKEVFQGALVIPN